MAESLSPRPRRPWWWVVALPLLALAAGGALLWWCARTDTGTAWLLERIPGLAVTGSRGSLLGDFEAGHVEIALPRDGRITIDALAWRGLELERAGTLLQWRIAVDSVTAQRVEIQPGAPAPGPSAAPDSLVLPIELRIDSLAVATLAATPLGATPVRDLQARLHLGADGGTLHRLDALGLAFGRLRARGDASLDGSAALPLQARVAIEQDGALANARWSAQLNVAGALAAPALHATLRAEPAGGRSAQSLDLRTTLRPFARWPIGDLDARAEGIDLSAFHDSAPVTALSGTAQARSTAMDEPARVQVRLRNPGAGRWDEGRLPLRELELALQARPDAPGTLTLESLTAELGTARQVAGRLQGSGHWSREGWRLDTVLAALQPALLDARAAALSLDGPLVLEGSAPGAPARRIDLRTELGGRVDERGVSRPVQLRLAGSASRDAGGDRIELREALAAAGGARATLSGSASRGAPEEPWQVTGRAALADFDPRPWWRGRDDSPWRRGPHRLNARAEFDLVLPPGALRAAGLVERLRALRGRAELQIADSQLAGVPLRGQGSLHSADGGSLQAALELRADANRLQASGRLGPAPGDMLAGTIAIDAPDLARLSPAWRLLRPDLPGAELAGSLTAHGELEGRWPELTLRGDANATALRVDSLRLQRGEARWRAGSGMDAPLEAQLELGETQLGAARLDTIRLTLQGSARAHRAELQMQTRARPPAWVDALQAAPASGAAPGLIRLQASGGVIAAGSAWSGWRGRIEALDARAAGAAAPWLASREIELELLGLDAAPLSVTLQPGRAELPGGAALRWSRIAWRASSPGRPADLDAQAELEPLAVAPLLARLQPSFGWGGDLALAGRLEVRSAPDFRADIVLERQRGDLTVTDELGTQALGLTDLRLGLNVADGVWSFTQGLAGSTLGVAAGAFVARTTPQARWPAPDAPVSGVLELRVANLGTWGNWVPAGWRLGGTLRVSTGIAGRFGAPEYTGEVQGSQLSVRNVLQGVNVSDGEVAIGLRGDHARIERFTARAGAGSIRLEGDATLGSTPRAQLTLVAEQFQLLGRIDRRIVTSGQARLQLERDRLDLSGRFAVDEGLIDFTRADAPSLSADVTVRRAAPAGTPTAAAAPGGSPVALPRPVLDVVVDLGERLRVRGRGLDTTLRGELRLTTPGGRLAVNGTVRTAQGTYAAYGQKLVIDRGELDFNGPAEDPRLDIEATRPNLDVRVGVAVGGSALNPRVRLFSEPDMADIDKLSWLVLGRASDGLGSTDVALLQRAALALLAGDGGGPSDQVTRLIGLDELSVRQTDGDVRETVVSLGKQLSRRWYVGYERSLNATAGTWQLIYRIAQRFTLRAQSGEDNALDLIWSWRWQ